MYKIRHNELLEIRKFTVNKQGIAVTIVLAKQRDFLS